MAGLGAVGANVMDYARESGVLSRSKNVTRSLAVSMAKMFSCDSSMRNLGNQEQSFSLQTNSMKQSVYFDSAGLMRLRPDKLAFELNKQLPDGFAIDVKRVHGHISYKITDYPRNEKTQSLGKHPIVNGYVRL